MNPIQTNLMLEKLKSLCPMPWYLDQDNAYGVHVKDKKGCTVYLEELDNWPDEMLGHMREDIINRARALAHYLVSLSEDQN